MIPAAQLSEVLERYPEIEGFLPEVLRSMGERDLWIEASEGQPLFCAGDRSPRFALLAQGRIRVAYPTRGGSELFLYYLKPGELCAMTTLALLSDVPSRASATAETPVRGLGLCRQSFLQLLERCEPFRRKVFDSLARRMHTILERLEEATSFDLSTRLARRLSSGGSSIATTHQQLAESFGCSREGISRLLERFQEAGWVRLGRGTIEVVDAAAIHRAASREDTP